MAFFKPTGQNNAVVDVDALPASMFIDANNVVDVCQIRILTRQQRKEFGPGAPDVVITSALQGKSRISRKQLAENFTFLNGKRIKLAVLHSDRTYTVKRYCNIPCKIIKLPSNVIGVHNGRRIADKGPYIVMQLGPDGNMDRSTLKILSGDNFRRLFKIPEQEIITRNRGKGHKELNVSHVKELYIRAKKRKKMAPRAEFNTLQTPVENVNTLQNNIPTQSRINQPQSSFDNMSKPNSGLGGGKANPFARAGVTKANPFAQVANQNNNAPANAGLKYPLTATHALYNITGEKLIGYSIKRIADGKEVDKSIDKVKELCAKRLIDNIMLVSNSPNDISLASKYLRGNGISLDKLPRKLLKVQ